MKEVGEKPSKYMEAKGTAGCKGFEVERCLACSRTDKEVKPVLEETSLVMKFKKQQASRTWRTFYCVVESLSPSLSEVGRHWRILSEAGT